MLSCMWQLHSMSVAGFWVPARFLRPPPATRSWFAGRTSTAIWCKLGSKALIAMALDWPAGFVLAISRSLRWTARTGALVVGEASQIALMPKRRLEPSWQAPPRPSPKLAVAPWRCGARFGLHASRRSRRERRQPTSCTPWWSLLRMRCAHNCVDSSSSSSSPLRQHSV